MHKNNRLHVSLQGYNKPRYLKSSIIVDSFSKNVRKVIKIDIFPCFDPVPSHLQQEWR